MPKVKVTLSIGFITANREEIIDIDDDEYMACETGDEKEQLMEEYWQDWANNYIEGNINLIDNGEVK